MIHKLSFVLNISSITLIFLFSIFYSFPRYWIGRWVMVYFFESTVELIFLSNFSRNTLCFWVMVYFVIVDVITVPFATVQLLNTCLVTFLTNYQVMMVPSLVDAHKPLMFQWRCLLAPVQTSFFQDQVSHSMNLALHLEELK